MNDILGELERRRQAARLGGGRKKSCCSTFQGKVDGARAH